MSTDRKSRKKKRSFLHTESFRIVEYGLIGLLVLLFGAGALFYGLRGGREAAEPEASPSPSPVPTADVSIRGRNVLQALTDADVAIELTEDGYALTAPNGVSLTMTMTSDPDGGGIETLTYETLLCPDPADDSAASNALREENADTLEALRTVFDAVLPVFRRGVADSETLVKQCRTVVKTGDPYAKKLGDYAVRILSDADALPQRVTVVFSRNG